MTISFISEHVTLVTALAQVVRDTTVWESPTAFAATVLNNELRISDEAVIDPGKYAVWLVKLEIRHPASLATYSVPCLLNTIPFEVATRAPSHLRIALEYTQIHRLQVTEPDGKPAAGAMVMLLGELTGPTECDKDGCIYLLDYTPGCYRVEDPRFRVSVHAESL